MIAGGGTGGHIYPAIAIAREYLARDPERSVVFVGTEKGLEKTIVPKAGFPLEFIDVGGLKGKGGLDLVRNVFRVPKGFVQAWQPRRQAQAQRRPRRRRLLLGTGARSPRNCAASRRSSTRPTPSPASRTASVARFVTAVAVAFEEALPRLKRPDGVVTGNPIRKEFFEADHPATGNAATRQRLLIFGGSQGSRILNETMTGALLFLARLKDSLDDRSPDRTERARESAEGVSRLRVRERARRPVSRSDRRRDRPRPISSSAAPAR